MTLSADAPNSNMSMEVELDGLFRHNATFDYDDDYEYKEELDPTSHEPAWIPAVYSLLLVVGLLGNLLLLAVLAQRRRSWRVSDTLVLHLCLADILLLLTLPFRAAQAAGSGLCSRILCKACGAVFHMNFFCGIFLLVYVTFNHYLASGHANSHRKPRSVHITCFSVWLLSLLLTVPDWIFLEAKQEANLNKVLCFHSYSGSPRAAARLFHHVACFTLPMAALIFCSASILLRMQCSCKALQKQRAARLILPSVGVFFLCWVPYNFALFVDTLTSGPEAPPDERLSTALLATSVLGCVHACARPLLYLGVCRNFRKRLAALLRRVAVEPERSLWELAVEEDVPEQSHHEEELKQMTSAVDHQTQSDRC